jgi:hypothetical protein
MNLMLKMDISNIQHSPNQQSGVGLMCLKCSYLEIMQKLLSGEKALESNEQITIPKVLALVPEFSQTNF